MCPHRNIFTTGEKGTTCDCEADLLPEKLTESRGKSSPRISLELSTVA